MTRRKTIEKEIFPLAVRDINNGASIKEIVQKYKVSEYYAKKWTGIVYKDGNARSVAAHRYRWCVNDELMRFEIDIGRFLPPNISDRKWDEVHECLKKHLWNLAISITEAN